MYKRQEISNKTFSFKEENFSKKHIIFDKLELSENYENIKLKIKRGYKYLFYPTVEIIAMADKALRKSIEDVYKRQVTDRAEIKSQFLTINLVFLKFIHCITYFLPSFLLIFNCLQLSVTTSLVLFDLMSN